MGAITASGTLSRSREARDGEEGIADPRWDQSSPAESTGWCRLRYVPEDDPAERAGASR